MKLEEFEALEKAATPGPWRTHPIYGDDYGEVFGPTTASDRVTLGSQADASFIAACREMVPKLIKALKAARIVSEFGFVGKHDPNVMDYLSILLDELEQP